jgi:hypothetical protein
MSTHGTTVATASGPRSASDETDDINSKNLEIYGDLPPSKRRKFILVDDPARGSRVRVRVMLDQVEMKEIPDSYRKTNAVYPRSYFPMQTASPPSPSSATFMSGRFPDDDDDDDEHRVGGRPGIITKTMVPVPRLEGGETEMGVRRLGRSKRRKEITLNDLGFRMSWSQSRVFAGRTMFLQKSRE